MLDRGFTLALLNRLVRTGLATSYAEREQHEEKTIEIVRLKITEAGRQALTNQSTASAVKLGPPLSDSTRAALRLLAKSANGRTESNLLARGFRKEHLTRLVCNGLVTAHTEHAGRERPVEVTRMKITSAGRRAATKA
jgi:hypothetical protein